MGKFRMLSLLVLAFAFFSSCSLSHQIQRSAQNFVLNDSTLQTAHVGISIYEPATGKWWYNWQGDKYFVPASNTKLATCYAAMKHLGDSLVGLRYETRSGYTNIVGTGDPTFLHPDFKNQPVFDFLQKQSNVNYVIDGFTPSFTPLGNGWAWNDYQDDYMAERSELPIYGNVARFFIRGDSLAVIPSIFYNGDIQYTNGVLRNGGGRWFTIVRPPEKNWFHPVSSSSMYRARTPFTSQEVPFKTIPDPNAPFGEQLLIQLLQDTLHKKIGDWAWVDARPVLKNVIHSQPTDSLLKITMHRSDNFFAEQSLLMVSNEMLGIMNDEKIIDTLLKTDFKDLPQRSRWVDGSGLSRYNLFTPQDFVTILGKIQDEFGRNRIRNILPTGNEGTLTNYYKIDSTFIYAKTGTLSGVVALSGYLTTVKGKDLIFSVLVNNHRGSATAVRRVVEKFIQNLRSQY
jgi:D-alanyl-D-alanine carboxypeptidase/D-alanyl-D-alanine-endopeptidase (penicillin-binding protein 4)